LNRHPRNQRSLIMDTFCKNDLFDFGTISWNKLSNEWHEPYEFDCWEEKRIVLDMSEKLTTSTMLMNESISIQIF
jgi:hypothetical protein